MVDRIVSMLWRHHRGKIFYRILDRHTVHRIEDKRRGWRYPLHPHPLLLLVVVQSVQVSIVFWNLKRRMRLGAVLNYLRKKMRMILAGVTVFDQAIRLLEFENERERMRRREWIEKTRKELMRRKEVINWWCGISTKKFSWKKGYF